MLKDDSEGAQHLSRSPAVATPDRRRLPPPAERPCGVAQKPLRTASLPLQAADNPEQFYAYDIGEHEFEEGDDSDADPDYGAGGEKKPKKGGCLQAVACPVGATRALGR